MKIKASKMFIVMLYCLCLVTSVLSKPRYNDLDEDDQQLFRAVFDTPSYDNEEQEEDADFDKMDLLKDGLWAIKAKLTELRAFNQALVSNLLSTKMKIKDLITNHLPAKKHQHSSFDKKKPTHNMYSQPPAYYPHIPQLPQYEAQPALPQHGHDPYYGH